MLASLPCAAARGSCGAALIGGAFAPSIFTSAWERSPDAVPKTLRRLISAFISACPSSLALPISPIALSNISSAMFACTMPRMRFAPRLGATLAGPVGPGGVAAEGGGGMDAGAAPGAAAGIAEVAVSGIVYRRCRRLGRPVNRRSLAFIRFLRAARLCGRLSRAMLLPTRPTLVTRSRHGITDGPVACHAGHERSP